VPFHHAIRAASAVVLLCLSIDVAVSAEIRRAASSGADLIQLEGLIVAEDRASFQVAADPSGKAIVLLDSPGGSLAAGLAMGSLIHRKHFATLVPRDTLCASACALMWLAGNPRAIGPGGAVGFHAAFFEKDGSRIISAEANALVGAYLNQLGFSPDVVVHVTRAMPEKMSWLNESAARRMGIDVIWADQVDQTAPALPRSADSRKPYDPVSAVTSFYRALGAADGNAAAALIVPEKRGIGPFNEDEMARFFGNMRVHLKLVSDPRRLDRDVVYAEYRYVYKNGKTCSGTAEVTTTYQFGNTFIQRIKANC
jgi:hypothetical protein